MINWNEVTVGETEIVDRNDGLYLVEGHNTDYAWIKYGGHNRQYPSVVPHSAKKEDLKDWTIYDPWVEITDECTINDYGNIRHNGHTINYIDFEHGRYRRSEKGLRVWTRKEGWG